MLPGLFALLARDGLVPEDRLAPLLAALPPEQYVSTSVRGGEGFDAVHWPVLRDAALASFAARRIPALATTLAAITDCAGDRARLRAVTRRAFAAFLAGGAGGAEVLAKLWPDATDDDRALVAGPPAASRGLATLGFHVATAHSEAVDGLFAFHVHRRLPGGAAEAAAHVVAHALRTEVLTVDELLEESLRLVGGG